MSVMRNVNVLFVGFFLKHVLVEIHFFNNFCFKKEPARRLAYYRQVSNVNKKRRLWTWEIPKASKYIDSIIKFKYLIRINMV